MTDRYYLVKVPGPKSATAQVVKANYATIMDGCLLLYQGQEPPPGATNPIDPLVLVATFAPGRWITCELGVMKSPEGVKPPDAPPQEGKSG